MLRTPLLRAWARDYPTLANNRSGVGGVEADWVMFFSWQFGSNMLRTPLLGRGV